MQFKVLRDDGWILELIRPVRGNQFRQMSEVKLEEVKSDFDYVKFWDTLVDEETKKELLKVCDTTKTQESSKK